MTDWFEWCRQFSPRVRALQGRDRRLAEVLECDDCQQPEGYKPCDKHPVDYASKENGCEATYQGP